MPAPARPVRAAARSDRAPRRGCPAGSAPGPAQEAPVGKRRGRLPGAGPGWQRSEGQRGGGGGGTERNNSGRRGGGWRRRSAPRPGQPSPAQPAGSAAQLSPGAAAPQAARKGWAGRCSAGLAAKRASIPPSLLSSLPPSLFFSLSRLSSSLTHWILPAAGLAASSPPAMNPTEGAAEEGAVPDSEVDAFFRTGRGAAGEEGAGAASGPASAAGCGAGGGAGTGGYGASGGRCERGSPPVFLLCPPQTSRLGLPGPSPAPGRMLLLRSRRTGLPSHRRPGREGTGWAPAPGRHKSSAGMLEASRVTEPWGRLRWLGLAPRAVAATREPAGSGTRSRLSARHGSAPSCRLRVDDQGGGASGSARPLLPGDAELAKCLKDMGECVPPSAFRGCWSRAVGSLGCGGAGRGPSLVMQRLVKCCGRWGRAASPTRGLVALSFETRIYTGPTSLLKQLVVSTPPTESESRESITGFLVDF